MKSETVLEIALSAFRACRHGVWLVCVFVSLGTSGAELFGPSAAYRLRLVPRSVAVADFNGDGAADVATATTGGQVSFLLGNGLGDFVPGADVLVGFSNSTRPRGIALGDFNRDGATDLAVTNLDSDSVSILLGDGEGGFGRTDFGVGSEPLSVAVGEFNGDGAQDLAVANLSSSSLNGTVTILLGNGIGGFVRSVDLTVGRWPRSVAVAEFNGDGKADLAVANSASGSVSILLGDGLGGFVHHTDVFPQFAFPVSLTVGDSNGDGAADLVVLGGSVYVLLGDGLGGFASTPPINLVSSPKDVEMSDFTGDGILDLLMISDFRLFLLRGDGAGSFAGTDISMPAFPTAIAVGEFNGDDTPDLAVTTAIPSAVRIIRGNGLGGVRIPTELGVPAASVAVGKPDDDGIVSLALARFRTVKVLRADGLGGFEPVADIDVGVDARSIVWGEFNGDDVADLAVANFADSTVSILRDDGLGNFDRLDLQVGPEPLFVVVGEFNGDGLGDLAVANSGDDTVSILLSDGLGGFRREDIPVGTGPISIAAGEFNGDRFTDLAVLTSGEPRVQILLGNEAGGFVPRLGPAVGNGPRSIAAADFNGDGSIDLAMINAGDKTVAVFLGNDAVEFDRVDTNVTGVPVSIAPGEFNGDNILDLAVTTTDGFVSILVGDGLGAFEYSGEDIGVSAKADSVAAGDTNGDGATDLIVGTGHSFSGVAVLLLNQIRDRTDVNGSNRIDGFDVAQIGRHAGASPLDTAYRRNADVDLNGVIDGQDLALVTGRFGELRRRASLLRATLQSPLGSDPDTVTFQPLSSEEDLLTVRVLGNDNNEPVATADITVTFQPTDEDPRQLLEVEEITLGTCLSGGVFQVYGAIGDTPGQIEIIVATLPGAEALCGQAPLFDLTFRARREGTATLDFGGGSALFNLAGQEVPGLSFLGGAVVSVSAEAGGPPGQRIGLAPEMLDFGRVHLGETSQRTLRISNSGWSELLVSDVTASADEFRSFFTSPFAVQPFSFINLTVEFSPTTVGSFEAELAITSNDPQSEVRIPLVGSCDP